MRPIVATLVLAAMLGCTSDPTPSATSQASPAAGPAVIGRTGPIVVAAPQDGTEDAEVGGTITWTGQDQDCLTAGPGDTEGVVWPAGTTWDPNTNEVVLPNNERLQVGEQFTFGGGSHDTRSVPAANMPSFGLTIEVYQAARTCGWTSVQYIQEVD